MTLVTLAVSAQAGLIQNGDFSGTSLSSPGGFFGAPGAACASNVTSWITEASFYNGNSCGTTNTPLSLLFNGTNGSAFNGTIGLYGMTDLAGYSGNYIADDGAPNYSAPFAQEIDGLTAGASYTVTFYQSAAQQKGSEPVGTSDYWQVFLSSSQFAPTAGYAPQNSATMTIPSDSQTDYTSWSLQTMTFTAPSATDYINFFAVGSGVPPVALLADVSLTATANPAPEPESLPIMGAALLGLFAVSRRRKRSA
jgi:hypothetical protein